MAIRGICAFLSLSVFALAQPFNYRISTFAGSYPLGDGGAATSALLAYPMGGALDRDGNIYFADSSHHLIRRISRDGRITTFAGNGEPGFQGDGGPAERARLFNPVRVAFDADGNLFIADINNHRIRRVDRQGIISTVAGIGLVGFSGDGGQATSARVGLVEGIAFDRQGNLYFTDGLFDVVRKVERSGRISLFAGNGNTGFRGDGGLATSAELNWPVDVAVDGNGNVLICELFGHRIRRVTPEGFISSILGRHTSTVVDNNLSFPTRLVWTQDGLYFAHASRSLSRLTGSSITLVAGNAFGFAGDGGPAISAAFRGIEGIAIDSDNSFIVADYGNHRIRRIRGGTVTTIAGRSHFGGDGGPGAEALFFRPASALMDPQGNLLVSDTLNHRIRRIDSSGRVATMVGTGFPTYTGDGGSNLAQAGIAEPRSMAYDVAGNLLFADSGNGRLRAISPAGVLRSVAGRGFLGDAGDGGQATGADFNLLRGVAADSRGNIYISDSNSHRVRRISPDGIISPFAGTGTSGYSGDGGPAVTARIANPGDVAVGPNNEIFFADEGNRRIRKISVSGIISTVAGSGTPGDYAEGANALTAPIFGPAGLAFDGSGDLFFTEPGRDRVSVLTRQGTLHRIAGSNEPGYSGDGGLSINARLYEPESVVVAARGSVLVVDTRNNRIRLLTPLAVARMAIQSGNNQQGRPGDRLPPLAVRVTSSDDTGLTGVTVNFQVVTGTAALSAASTQTISGGVASTVVTLGERLGPVTVRASVATLPPVDFSLTVEAPPTLGGKLGIVAVRSAGPSGADLQALAPNLLADVLLENLAVTGVPAAIEPVEGKLPTQVAGLCIEAGGVFAPIRGIQGQRVSIIVPHLPAGSQTELRGITGCGSALQAVSAPLTLPVQPALPELLAARGTGPDFEVALSPSDAEVKPGATITLLAIGLGPTDPEVAAGAVTDQQANAVLPVSVRVGDTAIAAENISYAGLAPNLPGIYAVTVKLPDDLPAGRHRVSLRAGDFEAPAGASITVRE